MATDGTEGKPKRPGGAERKRRKNEARKLELLAELRALGWRPSDGTPIDAPPEQSDDGSTEFSQLGAPDLDDPDTLLSWSRKYQATAAHLAATRPLTDALKQRLSLVDKFTANIGVTQNRAEVEERLEAVEHLIANVKPHGAIQRVEAHGHPRAAASSRGRSARRLRPLPGPTPRPGDVSERGRSPEDPDGGIDPDGRGPVR